MAEVKVRAEGLRFPEGPVALADGSVLVCEVERGTLTRVTPAGERVVVAACGGGPNGAAAGPDGRIYVANNGGFDWDESAGFLVCVACSLPIAGRIEAVDLATGEAETLYTECDGRPLEAPNDIVFDAAGGFYFTDSGHWRGRVERSGAIYYAQPDGSRIDAVVDAFPAPNGIGLSPDGRTLYVANSTPEMFVRAYSVARDGTLSQPRDLVRFTADGPGARGAPDGLKVDSLGNVWTTGPGGVVVVAPDGRILGRIQLPARASNLAFGDDYRSLFITSGPIIYRLRTRVQGLIPPFTAR